MIGVAVCRLPVNLIAVLVVHNRHTWIYHAIEIHIYSKAELHGERVS